MIVMAMPSISFHIHRHIMFVWYLPFLLIALIGLDRLFDKKKPLLFIVSAFLIIMVNYFYSVGSLVALFIYAVYRLLSEEKPKTKAFFKRLLYITLVFLIPVLIAAFFLLPTAYALFANGRATESSFLIKELFNSVFLMSCSKTSCFKTLLINQILHLKK